MRTISLITDLGNVDHYASIIKGNILKHSQNIHIVDVSHSISSHDIQEASFMLKSIVKDFPSGTIHVISVYNYYIPKPEFVLLEYNGHFFIAPNNGVLSLAFHDLEVNKIHKIELKEDLEQTPVAFIAHGVSLLTNGLDVASAGPVIDDFERKLDIKPVVTKKEMRATIIYIDQFENVILNVEKSFFESHRQSRPFKLYFKYQDPITVISNSYGDVAMGDVLCFFNNANYLEIAINMGKASSMLDLYKGDTIQIYFE